MGKASYDRIAKEADEIYEIFNRLLISRGFRKYVEPERKLEIIKREGNHFRMIRPANPLL